MYDELAREPEANQIFNPRIGYPSRDSPRFSIYPKFFDLLTASHLSVTSLFILTIVAGHLLFPRQFLFTFIYF